MQRQQLIRLATAAGVAIGIGTAAYAWGTTITGSGTSKTETRHVGSINAVSVAGIGELVVETGTKEKLTVEADDNLLAYIKTETHGDTLTIGVKENTSINPRRPIRYHLTVRSLNAVTLSGTTSAAWRTLPAANRFTLSLSGATAAHIDRLVADSFQVNVSGASKVTVGSGRVRQQSLELSGASHYDAFGLTSDTATVSASGSSGVNITAKRSLSADASGVSVIRYKGKPLVRSEVSGVSSVDAAR